MACSTFEDCGLEYTSEGCLVRDERNTIFHIKTDEFESEDGEKRFVRYKQRVNASDLNDAITRPDIPRVDKEDRDLAMYTTVPGGYMISTLAKTKKVCTAQSRVCVNGECRPSSEMTSKVKVAGGCLAQVQGSDIGLGGAGTTEGGAYAMLIDTETKTYRILTDAADGDPPSFYKTCLRDAPKVKDPSKTLAGYAQKESVSKGWKQHYCSNAAPCSKDDLPVIMSERQTVVAAREKKDRAAIEQVCSNSPDVCTLFAPGVTLDECVREPEACAGVVLDPKNRCDFFPKGAGCVYRPPALDERPVFYPFEKYAKILEAYNMTLTGLAVLLVAGAVGYAVWVRKRKS